MLQLKKFLNIGLPTINIIFLIRMNCHKKLIDAKFTIQEIKALFQKQKQNNEKNMR